MNTNFRMRHVLAAALVSAAGCAEKSPPMSGPSGSENFSKLEQAYDKAVEKLGRPPATSSEFKPFLQEFGNPDEILRSPRDGEPYVIIYGVDIRKPFQMPPPIWVHEKNGVGGERYALTVMGIIRMTDEEFAKAKFVQP